MYICPSKNEKKEDQKNYDEFIQFYLCNSFLGKLSVYHNIQVSSKN